MPRNLRSEIAEILTHAAFYASWPKAWAAFLMAKFASRHFHCKFEPGCRNNWHIHYAKNGGGQILVSVAGKGWYQEWGKPAQQLNPGDVVNVPTGVKHWHGATADTWFAHLAIEVPGEKTSNQFI